MIDLVGRNRWFFLASWILVAIGIISLLISQIQLGAPLRLGIDFTGGTSMMLHINAAEEITLAQVQMVLVLKQYEKKLKSRLG